MKREERTRRRRAVAVAKDVLKWITKEKASEGTYLSRASYVDGELAVFRGKSDKTKARLAQKNCYACALGACFLSTVGLFDKFDFGGAAPYAVNHWEMRERLREIFDDQQMADIESAFEQQVMSSGEGADPKAYGTQDAVNFGYRYKTAVGRMRAIMRNIIANDGVFIPKKRGQ